MFCYYAHCTSIYNTPQEKRDIETLESLGFYVYNPNNEMAAKKYEKEGMSWFYNLVKRSELVAFRSLPDGRIPAGIAGELEVARENHVPIIQLPNLSAPTMSVEETRAYLHDIGQR